MSEPTEQELRDGWQRQLEAMERIRNHKQSIIRNAICKAQNRYGSIRKAGKALDIDFGYLQCLKTGAKQNPSDEVLRKLRLLP